MIDVELVLQDLCSYCLQNANQIISSSFYVCEVAAAFGQQWTGILSPHSAWELTSESLSAGVELTRYRLVDGG